MSNPSADKAPVLKWQKGIEDKSQSHEHTSDQQAQSRFYDSVYTGRTEQKKSVEQKETQVHAQKEGQASPPLKGRVEQNVVIDGHGNVEPYPQAQMSRDANGKLDHIDFKPNEGRK